MKFENYLENGSLEVCNLFGEKIVCKATKHSEDMQ